MDFTNFFNQVLSIVPGSFVRISYKTTVPVKAQYKKEGYSIEKLVDETTRVGIDYHKIGPVMAMEKGDEKKPTRKSKIHWDTKKYFLVNEETGDKYLAIYPMVKNSNKKETFVITTPDIIITTTDADSVKKFVNESYWDKKFSYQKSIKVSNILKIGGYEAG